MSEPEQLLIRNCRFAFRRHQSWRGLERTTDPRLRYCHECAREVVYVRYPAWQRGGTPLYYRLRGGPE